ncbi:hypothetical protein PF004_g23200 [Phytophthora fragariae]|uniref:Uncharacterized protein n=1 Tax=Phytophthora fragariae TaxID=53985 RepID=A0A6G0MZ98_9STRA|nr:hypothetical protein PF004_g23200 [Phytophthora fragariae]
MNEAWAPEGFCVFHDQRDDGTTAISATETTTADSLPEDVVNVADSLFTAIVDFCEEMDKRSMQVFNAEFVDAQDRRTLEELRRRVQERGDSMEDAQILEKQFHARICDDDVHSDEDLASSLSKKGISGAEDLVRTIDSNGSEIVARDRTLRDALTLMQAPHPASRAGSTALSTMHELAHS